MIEELIADICDFLEIEEPNVSYDESVFLTPTTMAQCDLEGPTIYLRPIDKINPDYVFAVIHELRHIWQMQAHPNKYFGSYRPVNLCSSIEEYNLQLAEVDANAFASVIMTELWSMKPQWNGLSKKVVSEIEKRTTLLAQTLFD